MNRKKCYLAGIVLLGFLTLSCITAEPKHKKNISFQFAEHLGNKWSSQLLHKTLKIPQQGLFYAGKCALFYNEKEIPMQLDNIKCFSDGSIRQTDIWFRTDMPANAVKTFELRNSQAPKAQKTDLYIKNEKAFIELGNKITAVRVPQSGSKKIPGPLMGIKLEDGKWSGQSYFSAGQKLPFAITNGLVMDLPLVVDDKVLSYTTEILAIGPIFYRYCITYKFAKTGHYQMTVTVRSGDPVIYFDEKYNNAGTLNINLNGYKPDKVEYKQRPWLKGTTFAPNYKKPEEFAILVGYDGAFVGTSAVYIMSNKDQKDCLGLLATQADSWLPFPYNQALHISTTSDGLGIKASLQNGQRHWGIFIGQKTPFKNLVEDFSVWWWQNICINMDKVLNWKLVWPEMDEIEFPHTFFAKKDLQKISKQLQKNPTAKKYMKKPNQTIC